MPSLYEDASAPGAVDLPPSATDGTQTIEANGTLEITKGARVILGRSLYVLPATYVLFDYSAPGAKLEFVPPAAPTTATLLDYLTVDGSELSNVRIQTVTLDAYARLITVTLVGA